VALRGTRALMPRGSYLLRAGTVTAVIGEPIPTQGLSEEERANLNERVRSLVQGMLVEE
jgi:1-acyl-sn-glycerol-3-phosphate acyltransferase